MEAILLLIRTKYSDVTHIDTATLAHWLSVPGESLCGQHKQECCSDQGNDDINNTRQHTDSLVKACDSLVEEVHSLVLSENNTSEEAVKSLPPDNQHVSGKIIILFDVRDEVEYEISHLQGARRISDSISDEKLRELLMEYLGTKLTAEGSASNSFSPDGASEEPLKIICYCSVGYRSSGLARRVAKHIANFNSLKPVEVYNLEGSIFKWANEDRDMINSNGNKTKFVHPYNTVFGLTLRKELRKYE
ncbi:uncharacterized protein LOC121876222 isoform X2 [Homarus americanus]|uniref:Putative Rhodanese-like domain-containing protein n=2 Tax=Homarus americanus TaxID=6706 RepID=A0A8J5MR73_HOMAM|nr:uncharacterized protein LOC121876222 isoform X2 [Homarus americanus]KAG7160596.1 putative Rhodanese-like domain-containing protein [Homarus americanus]